MLVGDGSLHKRRRRGAPYGGPRKIRPRGGRGRSRPMKWMLVAVIVAATTAGDVLKAKGMKDHGEIHQFGLGALGRVFAVLARKKLIVLSIACMAVSFFTFM